MLQFLFGALRVNIVIFQDVRVFVCMYVCVICKLSEIDNIDLIN